MKKCAYCGRENRDNATHCSECGTAEFAIQGQASAPRHALFRFLVGAIVGCAVSVFSLFVAWQNMRDEPHIGRRQDVTRFALRRIDRAIKDRFATNKPPRTIAELREFLGDDFPDGWGNPFIYEQQGTNFLVISYGRDGRPGGEGLDCDLTTRDLWPKTSSPTFSQFYHDLPTGGILSTCIICGLIAFITSLVTVKAPSVTRAGLLALAIKLGATIIGAVIIAAVISALHIPSH